MLTPDGATRAMPTASPDGSLIATPRTGPGGICGRVLPWPIGLGSVLESCHWKMPPGGTLVSSTFMPMVPAGSVGVGVGAGLGDGLGLELGPTAETVPPPQ